MNIEEATKILSVLKVAYPGFYSKATKEDAKQAVRVWAEMFKDDDYRIVSAAVKAVINEGTNGYPPDIGRVKEMMRSFMRPEQDTAMSAWNAVKRAINYYFAKENFAKLPELAQYIVGSPNQLKEWALMSPEDINTVVQSNFIRAYRAREKEYHAYQALPDDVKKMVALLRKGTDLNAALEGSRNEIEGGNS